MPIRLISQLLFISCALFLFANAAIRSQDGRRHKSVEDFPVLEANCDEFFFGTPFPRPIASYDRLVKLCQTQQHDRYVGPAVYATLFGTKDRIPIYSAGVLAMYPMSKVFMRPNDTHWERLSLALCNMHQHNIPRHPVSSRISMVNKEDLEKCGRLQAINRDYAANRRLHALERGHLNPNAINFQDLERQMATFTLTNAAPQYYQFDEISWEELECMTKFVIFTHIPLERVYIITGTLGIATDKNKNPIWMNGNTAGRKQLIRVPRHFWKAVCYPGNPWKGTPPWAYVIVQRNTIGGGESGPDKFQNLREFSTKHFKDDLFHAQCMDAPMGPIQNYFFDWKKNVGKHCHRSDSKTSGLRWPRSMEHGDFTISTP